MSPKTWAIKNLLKVTSDYLKEKQIESPRLTAEILLAHQLNIDRVSLYINFDQPLEELELSGYRSLIKRRLQHEPLQYITGVQEFWSLNFIVNPQVLIPRPESEMLVELTINQLKASDAFGNHPPRILELGTGCGAVTISLAKDIREAEIWATDISSEALKLATLNAKKHGVNDRIEFKRGDLWNPLIDQDITFDIILSNPPYIAYEEYNDLPPEIRDHEPRTALDGKRGGMYYIEKILREGPRFLKHGGFILLEMSPDQTNKALGLISQINGYGESSRIKDYSHRYRVVMAQRA